MSIMPPDPDSKTGSLPEALHDLFHDVWHVDQPTNMAASVLALLEMAALLADAERVKRVRELHRPYERWADTVWTNVRETACAECLTLFPCQTIRALDGPQP